MATDIFLKIPEIKGESKDARHPDEIEILSWSWGLAQIGGGVAVATGAATGKVQLSDLNFMHTFDKASPMLMQYCATGKHLKEATLTIRKAGEGQQEYLIIKMNEVTISSVQDSGSEETPMESVSLHFARVDLEYKPQKDDGSLDAGMHFKYDLKANKIA
jgi:type VI secretion system secreted protein Hcp